MEIRGPRAPARLRSDVVARADRTSRGLWTHRCSGARPTRPRQKTPRTGNKVSYHLLGHGPANHGPTIGREGAGRTLLPTCAGEHGQCACVSSDLHVLRTEHCVLALSSPPRGCLSHRRRRRHWAALTASAILRHPDKPEIPGNARNGKQTPLLPARSRPSAGTLFGRPSRLLALCLGCVLLYDVCLVPGADTGPAS